MREHQSSTFLSAKEKTVQAARTKYSQGDESQFAQLRHRFSLGLLVCLRCLLAGIVHSSWETFSSTNCLQHPALPLGTSQLSLLSSMRVGSLCIAA